MTYRPPGYVKPRFRKVARTWELIIAILIFTFLLYRVCLAYELIPDEYDPQNIMGQEYEVFKKDLRLHMHEKDTRGKISKMTIGVLDDVEAYIERKRKESELRAQIAAKCGENPVYRLFMQSDTDADQCVKQSLQMEAAEKNSGIESIPLKNTPFPVPNK